ncbi:MAG: hypothetical protein KJZ78_25485, partial [Bryobacteraceae bacterium]|nr:hypothetical protein [Bryobacteraceae bacterium]
IISWPGALPENETRGEVAHAADWLPTLADLCDVDPPSVPLDGRSLVGMLRDANADPHDGRALHWQVGVGQNADWAVREGDWKLIGNTRDTGTGASGNQRVTRFLVNIKSDPRETTNLADEHPEIVARLRALHEHHLD